MEPVSVQRQLAGFGSEEVAVCADDVAEVDQLPELEIALAHHVFFDVDLKPFSVLGQMGEARLAHAADGLYPSGDAYADTRLEFFGGLGGVLGQDLRDGVGEVKALAVRLVAEGFDFANAREPLFQQLLL